MARTSVAFGLRLGGDLAVPGTGAPSGAPAVASVALRRTPRREVVGGWPEGARDVSRRRRADGRTVLLISHHARQGVLMRADGFGAYRIDARARSVRAALPGRGPRLAGPRFLVAQVLPFAALLHGLEVLHAGAVAIGGGAVAVTAGAHGGKSTLLAALVAGGAPLVADDVVAIDEDLGVLPGPALLSLRDGGAAALGVAPEGVGRPIGRTEHDDGWWIEVPRTTERLPLRALVVLRRDPATRRIRARHVPAPSPAMLLGATFNAAWLARDRVVAQLDRCARMAAEVPVFELHAPTDASPARLAAALQRAVAG